MKKMIVSILCIFFAGCDTFYPFEVNNNAEYPVTIFSEFFNNLESTFNPLHDRHPGSSYQIAFPKESVVIYSWCPWTIVPSLLDSGYVKIYVVDTIPDGDTLCIYYMDEQSIRQCKDMISFPPTEEMRDFKMWPPYGTYDANGNPVQ